MKIFHAKYEWHGRYGAYDEEDYIVIAETQSAALGWALTSRENETTKAEDWTITEIDSEKAGIHYISAKCS